MRDMTSVQICDTSYPTQWLFNRKSHMHIKVSLLSEFKSHINLSPNDNFSKLYKYNTNMSYYNLCGIGSQHSNISRGKGGTYKNHWYARLQSR
jgi:hypothetical protein